ncbi:hypothetical protein GCM10023063_21230 [Arthrobacter methylotrophus]|uniref:Uncharacterized protein n=1 Tax=Arthrobacter methylotrophus TaxID=121291 RepID=A0ABV5UVX2_9MICC
MSSRRTATWSARRAFHYRYDTAAEVKFLKALVRERLNLFTATTKATGRRSNKRKHK